MGLHHLEEMRHKQQKGRRDEAGVSPPPSAKRRTSPARAEPKSSREHGSLQEVGEQELRQQLAKVTERDRAHATLAEALSRRLLQQEQAQRPLNVFVKALIRRLPKEGDKEASFLRREASRLGFGELASEVVGGA